MASCGASSKCSTATRRRWTWWRPPRSASRSPSTTPRALDAICDELRQFAEVAIEEDQAIVCLVGENIRYTPGVAARVFDALERHQRPHDLAGRVAAEPQLRGGGGGPACARCEALHARVLRRARPERLRCEWTPRMPKLAIVGYGKMGRLIEQLAPEYGFAVALKLDEFNNAGLRRRDRGELSRRRCGGRFLDSRRGRRKRGAHRGAGREHRGRAPPAGSEQLDRVRSGGRADTASGWCGARIIRSA